MVCQCQCQCRLFLRLRAKMRGPSTRTRKECLRLLPLISVYMMEGKLISLNSNKIHFNLISAIIFFVFDRCRRRHRLLCRHRRQMSHLSSHRIQVDTFIYIYLKYKYNNSLTHFIVMNTKSNRWMPIHN